MLHGLLQLLGQAINNRAPVNPVSQLNQPSRLIPNTPDLQINKPGAAASYNLLQGIAFGNNSRYAPGVPLLRPTDSNLRIPSYSPNQVNGFLQGITNRATGQYLPPAQGPADRQMLPVSRGNNLPVNLAPAQFVYPINRNPVSTI